MAAALQSDIAEMSSHILGTVRRGLPHRVSHC